MVTTTPAPSRCWCLVSRWHVAQYRKIWGQAGLIRVSSEELTLVLLSLSLCSACPLMSSPMRTSSGTFPRISVSLATSLRIPQESRKNPPGPFEQPRLRSQVQFLVCQTAAPKTPVLRMLSWETMEAGRTSCVLWESIGRPGDRSWYQNSLDGILLSGRRVHQIAYNFQRPRFAPEIVGTS
jgi:hypothetical protein